MPDEFSISQGPVKATLNPKEAVSAFADVMNFMKEFFRTAVDNTMNPQKIQDEKP